MYIVDNFDLLVFFHLIRMKNKPDQTFSTIGASQNLAIGVPSYIKLGDPGRALKMRKLLVGKVCKKMCKMSSNDILNCSTSRLLYQSNYSYFLLVALWRKASELLSVLIAIKLFDKK